MIPIFEPYFFGNETKYINQCLKTKWISSQGSFVKKFEKKYDYKLLKVTPYKYKDKIVSSTRIRKLLHKGEINLANKLLSKTWLIDGNVIKGKKLGRKLGYRTCNIEIKSYLLPKNTF